MTIQDKRDYLWKEGWFTHHWDTDGKLYPKKIHDNGLWEKFSKVYKVISLMDKLSPESMNSSEVLFVCLLYKEVTKLNLEK